jgi:hypothetical protein
MKIKLKHIFYLIGVAIVTSLIVDVIRISSYDTHFMKPKKKMGLEHGEVYYELSNGERNIDWNRLDKTLFSLDKQYAGSDFHLVNLVRIIYEYGDLIPEKKMSEIESTLLNYRYWWDEPGENSMCYWSENHQILYASAEYLIGQKYHDKLFPNSGLTGKEHMEKARKRTLDWLEMRWNYGFTEFYSEVYYKEDVGGLINLIDFAEDKEIAQKSTMVMDLLLYDVAAQNIHKMLASSSGRAYEKNRKGGPKKSLSGLTEYYWGSGKKIKKGMMYGMMTTQKYTIPPVFVDIAKDTSSVVIKQSNGLDLSELEEEGYYGTDNRSMMMQWSMEAFTNPEIIRNSLSHIRSKNMFSNKFISDFRMLDITLLRWLRLEPALVRLINPQSNGVAIQKGNTYTYKTNDYSVYSAQNHHPGTYGDQQHVAGMNMKNSFSIFHSHPGVEKGHKRKSPSYWIGYGHMPHAAQDSSVCMAIYNLPAKKGVMEAALLDYTHAYFPTEKFDSVSVIGNYAMGRKGDTYCALITTNELILRENTTDDLIQKGKQTFWIMEAGSKNEDNSFGEFCERVKRNKVAFDSENLELTYLSKGKKYQLKFKGDFVLDGSIVDTSYDRYDSPYIKAKKKAEKLTFEYNGKSLHLDFYNMKRTIN